MPCAITYMGTLCITSVPSRDLHGPGGRMPCANTYMGTLCITSVPSRDLHGPGGPRAGPGLDIKSRSRAGPGRA